MSSSDDILEFLSNIQQTLSTLSTKISDIESTLATTLPRLETALTTTNNNTRPPLDNDDLEKLALATPIRYDEQPPTRPTTQKESLARIEKKLADFEPEINRLQSIQTNTSRIVQLELDLARVDSRVRDIADAVRKTDAKLSDVDVKVDVVAGGTQDLMTGVADVKTRVERIERKVDGVAARSDVGLTGPQAERLARIEGKVDEAKVRDLAIYQNHIIRSLNGKIAKDANVHLVLRDVHTGESVYGNTKNLVDKESIGDVEKYLRQVGSSASKDKHGEATTRSIWWGYVRDDGWF